MKKRLFSMVIMAFVTFYIINVDVISAQVETNQKVKKRDPQVEYMHNDCYNGDNAWLLTEEQSAELDNEYNNLVFTLPEEEYVWDEEEIILQANEKAGEVSAYSVATVSTLATPKGIYTGGTATSTASVGSSSCDVTSVYDDWFDKITNSSTTQPWILYRFGGYMTDSFVMPGMISTNVKGKSCKHMVPQGIEYASGYMFISAYCSNEINKTPEHNPVIYVVNASTKKYVTTLVLYGKGPHVGGIAYANNYLWVCTGYDYENTGKAILHYYNFSKILEAIKYAEENTGVKSIDISSYGYGRVFLDSQDGNSFISTYNGYLCVGEYRYMDFLQSTPIIGFYKPEAVSDRTLKAVHTVNIPDSAQGIEFYTLGSNLYVVLSASSGEIANSDVYIYKPKSYKDSTYTEYRQLTMPCMVEGMTIYNGKTYFVFETCAYKYRTSIFTSQIVDKVCGMSQYLLYK